MLQGKRTSATVCARAYRLFIVVLLAIAAIFACMALLAAPDQAQARTRACDVTAATAGNELVKIPGSFTAVDERALLARVNAIRKEACDNGYANPEGGTLTPGDYRPMKWSANLEEVALTRAAEAAVLQDHLRPKGGYVFSMGYAARTEAECLAWNGSASATRAIEQWYSEKGAWVKGDTASETGHYTAMISPSNTRIAISGFAPDESTSYWGAVAGEFGGESCNPGGESGLGVSGSWNQEMEVPGDEIAVVLARGSVACGKTLKLTPDAVVSMPGIMGDTVQTGGHLAGKRTWSSSDERVATVDGHGAVTGVSAGTAKISVKCGKRHTSATVTVTKGSQELSVKAGSVSVKHAKLKKASQSVSAKKAFKVTKAQGKVTYKKASGNKKISVSKSGKVTVKKGLKKGTYKVKVKVTAAGNGNYGKATKTVTLKVKVK